MPKTGGVFTGNVQVRNILETLVTPVGNISGTVSLDLSLGNVFQITPVGNIVKFNLSNIPQAITGEVVSSFTIIFQQSTTGIYSADFIFSSGGTDKTVLWPGGFVPAVSSIYSAIDIFSFLSFDAGETWFGFVGGQGY
jgi:hypothetical protein